MGYAVIVYSAPSEGTLDDGEAVLPREAMIKALQQQGAVPREGDWYLITRRQGLVRIAVPEVGRYLTVEFPNVTRANFALAAELLTTLAGVASHLEIASPVSGKTLSLDSSSDAEIAAFLMTDWRGGLSCAITTLRRDLEVHRAGL